MAVVTNLSYMMVMNDDGGGCDDDDICIYYDEMSVCLCVVRFPDPLADFF